MRIEISSAEIIAVGDTERKAAEILADEMQARCGRRQPIVREKSGNTFIAFSLAEESGSEAFEILTDGRGVTVCAHRLRGLIYGFFLILRKSEIKNGKMILEKNIVGKYAPDMSVRGHNLSYTESNNTVDAWDAAQYRKYMIELMAFGTNTIEGNFFAEKERNSLMKMSFEEAPVTISGLCRELDLDLTVFYPLTKNRTDEETAALIVSQFRTLPKVNSVFLPGGDPGNMQAEDFVRRCSVIAKALSEIHPDIEIIPSAQAPHEFPDWGEHFKKSMHEKPAGISAVIFGPNHAMPLDALRRSIPAVYPLEQYPDITHNVRCETPVHFTRDDWHFAWASTLSRESVNPRPVEYRLLHRKTRQYLRGNTPYSEGVSDDVNKVVWSCLDFDFEYPLREALKDYARLFIPGENADRIADLIFGLEQNWECAPEESFSVENVYRGFDEMLSNNPRLYENWRFLLLYFRALCDKIVRDRRIFELERIENADFEIRNGSTEKAKQILSSEFSQEYKQNRRTLFVLAEKLFGLIGIQLDVEHFGGKNRERGCTLDSIDMPVTDRQYLLKKAEENPSRAFLTELLDRNKVGKDEYYFSFAQHGLNVCGMQAGEFYMDFNGDKNENADRPMCILNGFDHFHFSMKTAGMTGGDYLLRVTYAEKKDVQGTDLTVSVNGNTLYEGECFGGRRDVEYEKKFLTDGFCSIVYEVPARFFENGCALLEISEPLCGVVLYEFRFEKKNKSENYGTAD